MTRFVFTMMMHPEIQRRAQEEIDAVTGGHRLPTTAECVQMFPLSAISRHHHGQGTDARPAIPFAVKPRCPTSML